MKAINSTYRRPRLLLVTERYFPEDFIVNGLVEDLLNMGWRVTVLTQQPSYPRGRIYRGWHNSLITATTRSGIREIRFKTVLGYRTSLFYKLLNYAFFATFGSIVAALQPYAFDQVFIYQTGPLTMSLPGIVAARCHRKPVAIWTQDLWPASVWAYGFKRSPIISEPLNAFVRYVYSNCDVTLVSSPGFANELRSFGAKNPTFIPNWPMNEFETSRKDETFRYPTTFLFAGNVGRLQNLGPVIRGFTKALDTNPGFAEFVIVGDGSELQHVRKISAGRRHITFVGRVPSERMREYYEEADILVLPLADEFPMNLTLPSKFQMYLAVGKPILAIAPGEIGRIVREVGLGISVSSSNIEDIADGFLRIQSASGSTIRTWKDNSNRLLKSTYSRKSVVQSIDDILCNLTEAHGIRRRNRLTKSAF